MTANVISANLLTRHFKNIIAVNQISFEVQAGEIFGFLGHNGAGKTTTVRLLNGVINPTSGSACVLGLDPQVDGSALRARTGVLTETPSLDERLTAIEILNYYGDLYSLPKTEIKPRIDELLDEFELADRADEKIRGYSKGMKQRLALVRALLHKPELLFLDEPTSGLDPLAAHHVINLIERLVRKEGCTAFLCTHNLVEAQRICTRVAILEHGQIIAMGTPVELTQKYIRRLEVEIEVAAEQVQLALGVLQHLPGHMLDQPTHTNGALVVTINAYDAIPDVLATLVQNQIRVYRFHARDANLEQVYFTLHHEKEGEE